MHIGIIGARKYNDRHAVVDLIRRLPSESVIVTSGCKGVCTWTQEIAYEHGIKVMVYSPDLSGIRSWVEVAQRYYTRNRELIDRCEIVHAFISRSDGYAGGTRFEIEYATQKGLPVFSHLEIGGSRMVRQKSLPFCMTGRHQDQWISFFEALT